MRTLRKNKQTMYYSLYSTASEVYEEEGTTVKTIVDQETGETIPVEVGTLKPVYAPPVEFKANITSNLNKLHIEAYGVDQSAIYSEIAVQKGTLPLKIGAIIWRENPIVWEDEENRIPYQPSSDYTVMGLLTEYQHYDFYLLQRNTPEGSVVSG